jgi:hypothetical protein
MRLLFTFLLLSLIGISCNIINPDEQEPSFLYIPEFNFETRVGEGTTSQKITELWVYADEEIVGVYDLPASVPILQTGRRNIRIFAGIKNNGISETRIRYPFFEPFDTIIDLQSMNIDTLIPTFRYYEDVDINEKGFESGNFFIPAGANNGTFEVEEDEAFVFEGNRSGLGKISSSQSILFFKDDENLILDAGNVYMLEMNYSCNNKFAVGLISNDGANTERNMVLVMNPTTTGTGNPVWNKIYVDLGNVPSENPNANFFEMYIEATRDAGVSEAEIYLDNLKLVKFE